MVDTNPEEEIEHPTDAFEEVEVDPDIADLTAMFLQAKRAELRGHYDTLARGDFATLRMIGHNLAGSGGGYGFPRLSQLGTTLSMAARAGDAEAVRATLRELNRYLTAWVQRFG